MLLRLMTWVMLLLLEVDFLWGMNTSALPNLTQFQEWMTPETRQYFDHSYLQPKIWESSSFGCVAFVVGYSPDVFLYNCRHMMASGVDIVGFFPEHSVQGAFEENEKCFRQICRNVRVVQIWAAGILWCVVSDLSFCLQKMGRVVFFHLLLWQWARSSTQQDPKCFWMRTECTGSHHDHAGVRERERERERDKMERNRQLDQDFGNSSQMWDQRSLHDGELWSLRGKELFCGRFVCRSARIILRDGGQENHTTLCWGALLLQPGARLCVTAKETWPIALTEICSTFPVTWLQTSSHCKLDLVAVYSQVDSKNIFPWTDRALVRTQPSSILLKWHALMSTNCACSTEASMTSV